MKLTQAHKKSINDAARDSMCFGPFGHVEVRINYCCHRSETEHAGHGEYYNQMFYDMETCEPDLSDLTWLRDLKQIEDHPSGRVKLDLYVYSRTTHHPRYRYVISDGQLDHNLLAVFQDNELVEVRGNP